MDKIVRAFVLAGMEFTDTGGVEPKNNLVTILEGDDAITQMMDDIYYSLKDSGGEVLIAGLTEPAADNPALVQAVRDHIERLKAANITEKILVEEGHTNFIAPVGWHRSLAEEDFSGAPHLLYGDKLAITSWESRKVTILRDALMAQTFRAMFYALWKRAAPIMDDSGGSS